MDEIGLKVNRIKDKQGVVHLYRYQHQYTLCGQKNVDICVPGQWYADGSPASCEDCRGIVLIWAMDTINGIFGIGYYEQGLRNVG